MRRSAISGGFLSAACVAIGCGGEATPPPVAPAPTTFERDAAAEAAAQDAVTGMLAALDAGDIATLGAFIAPDMLVSYDIDPENKPIALNSAEELRAYLGQMLSTIQGMGANVRSVITSLNCQASATLGVCVAEVNQAFTVKGQTSTLPFRASMSLRKGSDGWKFTHWHASVAQVPPPPPEPPPPPPPPAFESKSIEQKALPWSGVPNAPPGFRLAKLWGDPATGPFAAFIEMPKGTMMPRHYHTQNTWAYITKGSMKVTLADGTVLEGKPGSFISVPAKVIHTTEAKGGVTGLEFGDGPEGSVFVDDAGRPVQAPAPGQ